MFGVRVKNGLFVKKKVYQKQYLHKNVSKKSPTAENILNHISRTLASNIDLPFINETIKELIAENKINNNFEIIEKPKIGDLFQSTDKAQRPQTGAQLQRTNSSRSE